MYSNNFTTTIVRNKLFEKLEKRNKREKLLKYLFEYYEITSISNDESITSNN